MEMATTIQVEETTRDELLRYASELQTRLGRRITFDAAIMTLIDESRGVRDARGRFERLFGSLKGEKGVWEELEEHRKDERRRLERKARAA